MASHPPLSIRPWSSEEPDKRALPFLISRIIDQKGGFRNVSEESLQEEMRTGESQLEDVESPSDKAEQDEKAGPEQIQATKQEIVQLGQQAFTESAHALDFLSLLLTRFAPKQAETTVSPFLKGTLPLASLGAEIVQQPAVSESKKQNERMVSTGWKLQALNSAADSILKSATRLEEEMKQEAKYWDQILAVKDKGWAISRMPRERHTLGVRFGFLESPTEFRDKGLAALRRGDDGAVELDLGPSVSGTKVLRARVLQGNATVAVSADGSDRVDDDSVESAILKARNSIFDSELFSELYREARGLANRGVKCFGNRINVPLDDGAILSIDLVDQGAGRPRIEASDASKKYETWPQLVVTALRILLSHSHRQHYRQRTSEPSVISERRHHRPLPSILRPILSHLQHRATSRDLRVRLQRLETILENAGVALQVGLTRSNPNLKKLLKPESSGPSTEFVHSLLEKLCGTIETAVPIRVAITDRLNGQVAPQICQLEIGIRTHASGTQYKVIPGRRVAEESLRALFHETWFSTLSEAMDVAANTIQVYLVRSLEAQSKGQLQSVSPHVGDLNTPSKEGRYYQVQVQLKPDSLTVRYALVDEINPYNFKIAREWTADSQHAADGRGLCWVVDQAAKGRVALK